MLKSQQGTEAAGNGAAAVLPCFQAESCQPLRKGCTVCCQGSRCLGNTWADTSPQPQTLQAQVQLAVPPGHTHGPAMQAQQQLTGQRDCSTVQYRYHIEAKQQLFHFETMQAYECIDSRLWTSEPGATRTKECSLRNKQAEPRFPLFQHKRTLSPHTHTKAQGNTP
jgi:hypothetical protein